MHKMAVAISTVVSVIALIQSSATVLSECAQIRELTKPAKGQVLRFQARLLGKHLHLKLSDVKRYLSAGKKALLSELHGQRYGHDKIENIWAVLRSLLLEVHDLLQSSYKKLKLREKLLYLITFFFFFSEFPDTLRHLCTTMPWTIWPSLVVLWGVCWMFYDNEEQQGPSNTWPNFDFSPSEHLS
jgi:hypothetical protein